MHTLQGYPRLPHKAVLQHLTVHYSRLPQTLLGLYDYVCMAG